MIGHLPTVVMQMCTEGKDGVDYITDFEFMAAVGCPYFDVAGLLVVGTLVYGAIAGSIYIRTGSVIIPFGLLFLTGGVVMAQVASVAVGLATAVVLLVGGGVVAYVYYQYS